MCYIISLAHKHLPSNIILFLFLCWAGYPWSWWATSLTWWSTAAWRPSSPSWTSTRRSRPVWRWATEDAEVSECKGQTHVSCYQSLHELFHSWLLVFRDFSSMMRETPPVCFGDLSGKGSFAKKKGCAQWGGSVISAISIFLKAHVTPMWWTWVTVHSACQFFVKMDIIVTDGLWWRLVPHCAPHPDLKSAVN